jgi:protein MYSM1
MYNNFIAPFLLFIFFSQNANIDYSMNPLWYNDDIPTSGNELIFAEEHIPIYFEEEVVAQETEHSHFDSTSSASKQDASNNSSSCTVTESRNKKALTINRDALKTSFRERLSSGNQTPQSASYRPFVLNEHTMRIFKNKIKAIQKKRAQALAKERKQRPKKIKALPQTNLKSSVSSIKKSSIQQQHHTQVAYSKKPENVDYIHYKPKPTVNPKNSGEILRMEKVDSDVEIDILSNSEDDDNNGMEFEVTLPEEDEEEVEVGDEEEEEEESSIDDVDGSFSTENMPLEEQDEEEETILKLNELKENDEQTYLLLESTEPPTNEIHLDLNAVTNVEKFMLSEFFAAKSSTKTPERYLKIRNHIMSLWNQCKPNYLSKTAARNGLKKCGDVNSISRVHLLLENIGAINFACVEVKYIIPLRILYEIFQQNIRSKHIMGVIRNKHDSSSDNNSSVPSSSDSMINRIKSRTQSRTQFELIKCQRYSKDNHAPFEISITLSCLLCLYFHALSSNLEIMGFLGGHVDRSNGKNKINLKCYKPCRTSTQTPISAEMCPVSFNRTSYSE